MTERPVDAGQTCVDDDRDLPDFEAFFDPKNVLLTDTDGISVMKDDVMMLDAMVEMTDEFLEGVETPLTTMAVFNEDSLEPSKPSELRAPRSSTLEETLVRTGADQDDEDELVAKASRRRANDFRAHDEDDDEDDEASLLTSKDSALRMIEFLQGQLRAKQDEIEELKRSAPIDVQQATPRQLRKNLNDDFERIVEEAVAAVEDTSDEEWSQTPQTLKTRAFSHQSLDFHLVAQDIEDAAAAVSSDIILSPVALAPPSPLPTLPSPHATRRKRKLQSSSAASTHTAPQRTSEMVTRRSSKLASGATVTPVSAANPGPSPTAATATTTTAKSSSSPASSSSTSASSSSSSAAAGSAAAKTSRGPSASGVAPSGDAVAQTHLPQQRPSTTSMPPKKKVRKNSTVSISSTCTSSPTTLSESSSSSPSSPGANTTSAQLKRNFSSAASSVASGDDDDDDDDDGDASGRKKTARRWTPEQDEELRRAVEKHNGQNWKAIANLVHGRDHVQCLQRWKKVLQPGLVKGMWRKEEDDLLLELMSTSKPKNWADVAQRIPGRTAKQCRERWSLNLDPSINRGAWTQAEDELLLKLHTKLGNRWAEIKRHLKGRTENGVKTRFKSIERARAKDQEVTWTRDLEKQLHDISVRFDCKIDEVAKHLPRSLRGISSQAMRDHCKILRDAEARRAKMVASSSQSASAMKFPSDNPLLNRW